LKKTYGGKPALALFAVLGKFKIEAYRGSEHAPRILTEKGFKVVMKVSGGTHVMNFLSENFFPYRVIML